MFTSPSPSPSQAGYESSSSSELQQNQESILDSLWGIGESLLQNPSKLLLGDDQASQSPGRGRRRNRSSPKQKVPQRAISVPARRNSIPLPTIPEIDESEEESAQTFYNDAQKYANLMHGSPRAQQRSRSSSSDHFSNKLCQLQSELFVTTRSTAFGSSIHEQSPIKNKKMVAISSEDVKPDPDHSGARDFFSVGISPSRVESKPSSPAESASSSEEEEEPNDSELMHMRSLLPVRDHTHKKIYTDGTAAASSTTPVSTVAKGKGKGWKVTVSPPLRKSKGKGGKVSPHKGKGKASHFSDCESSMSTPTFGRHSSERSSTASIASEKEVAAVSPHRNSVPFVRRSPTPARSCSNTPPRKEQEDTTKNSNAPDDDNQNESSSDENDANESCSTKTFDTFKKHDDNSGDGNNSTSSNKNNMSGGITKQKRSNNAKTNKGQNKSKRNPECLDSVAPLLAANLLLPNKFTCGKAVMKSIVNDPITKLVSKFDALPEQCKESDVSSSDSLSSPPPLSSNGYANFDKILNAQKQENVIIIPRQQATTASNSNTNSISRKLNWRAVPSSTQDSIFSEIDSLDTVIDSSEVEQLSKLLKKSHLDRPPHTTKSTLARP